MPFGDARQRSRPGRVVALLALIGAGVLLTRLVESGRVEPLFLPTPTPTRTAFSHQEEAEAQFSAGDLDQAIAAYQQAVSLTPDDSNLWAKLARIQTYSSALTPTDEQEQQRLQAAKASIDRAVELDAENGYAWAIRILVYDWLAGASTDEAARQDDFLIAEQAANRATTLESGVLLALAFNAELEVDQQDYAQAENTINLALARDGAADEMDVQRVHGTVLESLGRYEQAIEAYQRALELAPNFTFLHLRVGANYRRLGDSDAAIDSFQQAALINAQLGIKDPIPHLAIGRTWLQEGEFITAARFVEAAVSIDPSNSELLGFLGIAYFKARNYANAQEALNCAVVGCDVEAQAELLCTRLLVLDCSDEELQAVEAEALDLDPAQAQQLYAGLLCSGQGIEQCSQEQLLDLSNGVPGLELGDRTLEYYYTYGSVLAFAEECNQAEQIFEQLEQSYSSDELIMDIVGEGRSICPVASSN